MIANHQRHKPGSRLHHSQDDLPILYVRILGTRSSSTQTHHPPVNPTLLVLHTPRTICRYSAPVPPKDSDINAAARPLLHSSSNFPMFSSPSICVSHPILPGLFLGRPFPCLACRCVDRFLGNTMSSSSFAWQEDGWCGLIDLKYRNALRRVRMLPGFLQVLFLSAGRVCCFAHEMRGSSVIVRVGHIITPISCRESA